MKIPCLKSYRINLCLFFTFFALSCGKDSDLLVEYVTSSEEESLIIRELVMDDSFFVSNSGETVLDVLANDIFNDLKDVTISDISAPSNGSVTLNNDKTITYIPINENVTEDSFTYTTETTNEENNSTSETGIVKVTIGMGELQAFPGAEGFGKNTTGGRGGDVFHVTNLNDDGPGSLRDGLKSSGNRTIVFDVGGYIDLNAPLFLTGGGNVTIAGQTAPGDGITIRGYGIEIHESNIIIRHLRIRPGAEQGSGNDALRILGEGDGVISKNIIIDHCSFSWSTDENISISAKGNSGILNNITIQNSIISEPLQDYAFLIGHRVSKLSIVNNLFAHNSQRSVRNSYNTEEFELVNNIIYDFSIATDLSYGVKADVIGNIYKGGSDDSPNTYGLNYSVSSAYPDQKADSGHIYEHDNISSNNDFGLKSSNWDKYEKESKFHSNSLLNPISTSSLEAALLNNIGANVFSDPVDNRIINEYTNLTGKRNQTHENQLGGYPSLKYSARLSNYDVDKDGIADEWERSNGLDPTNSEDGSQDRNNDGYTNLEEFLHFLTR